MYYLLRLPYSGISVYYELDSNMCFKNSSIAKENVI